MATTETHELIVVEDAPATAAPVQDAVSRAKSDAPESAAASQAGFMPINTHGHDRDDSSSRRRSGRPGGDSLDKLRALPELRPIPWYEGRELPPEKSTQSSRVQTRGACLLVSRGSIMNPPCNHCAAGIGRFSLCVSSSDWFNGACATCQLATRGNLCTYRKKDTLRVKRELKSREEETNTLKSIPRQSSPSSISRTVTARPPNQPPSRTLLPSAPQVDDSDSSFVKKRKRDFVQEPKENLQVTTAWKPYISPYQVAAPVDRTSLPQTSQTSISATIIPPIKSLPQDDPPLMNYVRPRRPPPAGGLLHNELRYRPIASALPNNIVPHPNPAAHQASSLHGLPSNGPNGIRVRESTDSLSPSAQLLQPQQFMSPQERLLDRPQDPPPQSSASSWPTHKPEIPLIDSMPRKKQKHIYAIIGNMQSGIASCQQQAENIQRQLSLLQSALGIDNDETEDEHGRD